MRDCNCRNKQQTRGIRMTIKEAQAMIDDQYMSGYITQEEAQFLARMIRRTEGYGNKWSWQRQARQRAIVMGVIKVA